MECGCRNVAGHHTPDKTGQFSRDSSFGDVGSGMERNALVFAFQPVNSPVCISNHFRGIAGLPFLLRFGFFTHSTAAVTVCRFNEQSAQMAVSGLGDSGTELLHAAGVFTRYKTQISGKLRCRPEAAEIANLCQKRQGSMGSDPAETA